MDSGVSSCVFPLVTWLNFPSLKLCARWVIFTTPLHRVAQFPDVKGDPLRGAIICISEDGTIAVIALDGFQLCVPCDHRVLSSSEADISFDQLIRYSWVPVSPATSLSGSR